MVKANDLIKEQENKHKQKNKIYKKVFSLVEKKIKLASYYNMCYVYYELPIIIILEPRYNLEECKKYIIKKLKKNGFKIKVMNNNLLIGWFL